MNTLYCDPSQTNQVLFRFNTVEKIATQTQSDQLLKTIHELVGEEPIEKLVLVNQAESFTLVRILVAIFNALSYSLHIPLYEAGKESEPAGGFLTPQYQAEPNITANITRV